MARLLAKHVRRAKVISPLLPPLLAATRDLERAQLELKWIKEELPKSEWVSAVNLRKGLVPLQYILKSQPFGDLNIICREGVLIPRWETEEWCTRLAKFIIDSKLSKVNIVDACSGSGCIPLLLSHLLAKNSIDSRAYGYDISEKAVELAKENLESYLATYPSKRIQISFHLADVFDSKLCKSVNIQGDDGTGIDLVTSNPPYIPLEDYKKSLWRNGVEKSVRLYEPSLALIGNNKVYSNLIQNLVVPVGAKGFVFEVGYKDQADFVNKSMDSAKWGVGVMKDSASKVRCVIGWQREGKFAEFSKLCDDVY